VWRVCGEADRVDRSGCSTSAAKAAR
jgi:hypothetical protein